MSAVAVRLPSPAWLALRDLSHFVGEVDGPRVLLVGNEPPRSLAGERRGEGMRP